MLSATIDCMRWLICFVIIINKGTKENKGVFYNSASPPMKTTKLTALAQALLHRILFLSSSTLDSIMVQLKGLL